MIRFRHLIVLALLAGLLSSCGFKRRKYENPISKDTQQPDKVLFDKAINDIEKSRFEVARLTLQALINTYDTSEYLAKAKLAIADSWYREGGTHALAQAEAEYKDFILFYPTLEESAEAQEKVCMIHYKQMEKPDRDVNQSLRAEAECRQLLTQFPNSKFAPKAQQILREIQEVIADGDYKIGDFYHHKGSYPAAANRFQGMVDQYPLYSKADLALWELGDSYSRMGPRFRKQAGDAYGRILKDYPLSSYAASAKSKLREMELPIPEADPVAYNRMKYELDNRTKSGPLSNAWGIFRKSPDVHAAAKSGTPAMTTLRPIIPASVPVPATGVAGGTNDVTVQSLNGPSALDTQKDARTNPPAASAENKDAAAASEKKEGTEEKAQEQVPVPQNHTVKPPKVKKPKKVKAKPQPQPPAQTAPATPPATTPATSTPPAPPPNQ